MDARRTRRSGTRSGLLWLALLGLLLGAAGAVAQNDAPTAPGELRFEGANLFSTARGVFHRWHFTRVEIDTDDPGAARVELEVDVASLDTGIERRDVHLRTADFFDVEHFPLATVRVHDARPDPERGERHYVAAFDLDLHGVQKTLEGRFEVVGTSPLEVRGEVPLDRLDFGVGDSPSRWNPMSIRAAVPVSFQATVPATPLVPRELDPGA